VSPLQLAHRYLELFCAGDRLHELAEIFAPELIFIGPYHRFNSAQTYIDSLVADPPVDCVCQVRHEIADDTSAALFYRFSKPGVETDMAQFFTCKSGRIERIQLIFDTADFIEK
jgi:hypothetical protein